MGQNTSPERVLTLLIVKVFVKVRPVLFYLLPEYPGWHWHWYVVVEEARQEPCLHGSAKHGEACGVWADETAVPVRTRTDLSAVHTTVYR